MAQKKLKRFAEIETFPNVFTYPENMKGQWAAHFGNAHPLTLELACGKGEYTLGLAAMYPQRNFMGLDVKGNRIWVGAKKALAGHIANVAFMRTQIGMLGNYFSPGEVSEIWITFPDPQLRWSKMSKRLTHPAYLRLYKTLMQPGGSVHLKTDSSDLYVFTKAVIELYGLLLVEDAEDVHKQEAIKPELAIQTHYEGLNISGSNRIYYLRFTLNRDLDINLDATLKAMFKNEATAVNGGD
jgi:tRNA (guanine-N7-)-methyltransferase